MKIVVDKLLQYKYTVKFEPAVKLTGYILDGKYRVLLSNTFNGEF
jgi:hypothetical protein